MTDAAMATYIEARIAFQSRPACRLAVRETQIMGGPVLTIHATEDFGDYGVVSVQHPVPLMGRSPRAAAYMLRQRFAMAKIGPELRRGTRALAQASVGGADAAASLRILFDAARREL